MDGFGTPDAKQGVYSQLTAPDVLPRGNAGNYTGFKLFYREDTGLMDPAAVLRLQPRPEVVVTSRGRVTAVGGAADPQDFRCPAKPAMYSKNIEAA